MVEWWKVIWLFATAYALSAVCGMFRQSYYFKRRRIVEVLIAGGYQGCWGLGISLVWNKYFNNPELLLGLCVISALTGVTGIDQILDMVRKVKPPDPRKPDE